MVNIIEKDGIILLDSEEFDMKIDNNRIIYVKNKKEKFYRSIDDELEIGMTSHEKKKYLHELYTLMIRKMREREQS